MMEFKDYQIFHQSHHGREWRISSGLGIIKARNDTEASRKLKKITDGLFITAMSFVAVEPGLNPNTVDQGQ